MDNHSVTEVSDQLLKSLDDMLAAGDTLPADEIKKRYRANEFFIGSYRKSQIYREVLRLPISTEAAVLGEASEAVQHILDGVRKLLGDEELMVEFAGDGDRIDMVARIWQPEEQLRQAWKGFAEVEYKSANLSAVKDEVA